MALLPPYTPVKALADLVLADAISLDEALNAARDAGRMEILAKWARSLHAEGLITALKEKPQC